MKLKFAFKCPDAVQDTLNAEFPGRENEEARDELYEKVRKWFLFGEYVTVEVDTDKDTAVVVPNK